MREKRGIYKLKNIFVGKFTDKKLNALLRNNKLFNLNIENQLFIILLIPSFLIGYILDFFVFEGNGNVIGYLLFIGLLGVVIRHTFVLLVVTGILTFITEGATVYSVIFWGWYFFIAYVVSFFIQYVHRDREYLIETAKSLPTIFDKRDPYTSFHSKNVAYYSFELGKAMGLSKKECFYIYLGGLLHDVGKAQIPKEILNKPSRLTNEEYEIMKTHSEKGYEMLKKIPLAKKNGVLDMIRYHHERFDGKGYPSNLKGYEIPKVARIMAIADSFDAMTSKRAYRSRLDTEYAMNEIRKGKGTQFDPEIADVFLGLLENNKLDIKGVAELERSKHYMIYMENSLAK